MQAPRHIRAHSDDLEFEFVWDDDYTCRVPFRFLRFECPCAACVNEFTGERMIKLEDIPAEIKPAAMEFSGNYALKIRWSDGHDTGLYTFERLRAISQAVTEFEASRNSTEP